MEHNVNYFRHYLIGKRFTIRVDNRIVTYLQSKHHPKNRKLLNWSLQLSEYNFEIVHIPSQHNSISHCLSRIYCNYNIQSPDKSVLIIHDLDSSITHHQLQQAQMNDSYIKACYHYVHNKKHFNVDTLGPYKHFRKHFTVQNDVLLWKERYVIPPHLRHRILTLCHDHPMAGHFAIHRTLDQLQNKFFWPEALHDASKWVKSCKNAMNSTLQDLVTLKLHSNQLHLTIVFS